MIEITFRLFIFIALLIASRIGISRFYIPLLFSILAQIKEKLHLPPISSISLSERLQHAATTSGSPIWCDWTTPSWESSEHVLGQQPLQEASQY